MESRGGGSGEELPDACPSRTFVWVGAVRRKVTNTERCKARDHVREDRELEELEL